MHRKSTILIAVVLGFLSCSSHALATRHHKHDFTIKDGERAIIRAEQRYWRGKPVKVYLDSCWYVSSRKVRCEIEIEGSFYNIIVTNTLGETKETPSSPMRISETDDAVFDKGNIYIYYGTT